MVRVAVFTVYDLPGWHEEDVVTFRLAPGCECYTTSEAHACVLALHEDADPAVILDDEGGAWEFAEGTVRALLLWE